VRGKFSSEKPVGEIVIAVVKAVPVYGVITILPPEGG
jgi:hypothetical protein